MKLSIALLFACLSLAIVACGGGDDDENGESQAPAPAAESEGGGATVSMKDIKFNPEELTIDAGDSVTWSNDDSVGHDVTGDGFSSGDAGGLGQGDTFKHTFDKAGTFDYVCKAHPGMEGSVVVR